IFTLPAFLSTLRSNIHLSTCEISYKAPGSMSDYRSPPSAPSSVTTEHLPALTTYTATHAADRTSALRLVADSVAQQRQLSSYALITHPYPLSAAILLLGILSQYLEFYTFLTTTVGIVTSLLILVRALTSEYITFAEAINYNWLNETPTSRFSMISNSHNKSRGHGHKRSSSASSISSSGSGSGNVDPAPVISTKPSISINNSAGGNGTGRRSRNNSNSSNKSRELDTGVENIVIVAKWGEEEIIGALVMRILRKEKRCVVRAWTVKGKYRGNGVGRGLLEEGVRVAIEKGCVVAAGGWQDKEKGAGGMEFDEGHVSMYCPSFFG
ncbi:MAG: hypothetical protein Q9183_006570, partial [Haloplaca sp. 2 TL-2023]